MATLPGAAAGETRAADTERPIRLLRVVLVLAALAPAVMVAAVAWYLYRQALSEAASRLDQVARIAEEHALKVFETNFALANRVLDLTGNDAPAALLAREPELHAALRRMGANLPQLQGIYVMDQTGHMVATNRAFPAPHDIDFTDRAFYEYHRKDGSQPFITDVLTSRTTGEPFFDISVRRTLSDGAFGGAVSTSLSPGYFREFYRELTAGDERLGVALVRADGAVLASWPGVPVASDMSKAPTRIAVAGPAGVSNASVPGGEHGVVALRTVESYPVRVVAWLPQNAVVALWLGELAPLVALMLPLTLGLVYVAWVALRTTRQSLSSLGALQLETAQRQRAELALQQAQKLEALGRLTGGVAHDFNNLLMVISNNVYLHKRLRGVDADAREITAIDRAVAAGAKLTHQLLSFSRRESAHPAVIRLQDKLPGMMSLLNPALGSTIVASIEVEPSTAAVKLDEAELELALLNLAINARDAMPGGGRLEVKAGNAPSPNPIGRDGRFVTIQVSDSGSGIPPDILDRVFEPFFTTKPVGHGTGLGLSQVYGFCARAGGGAIVQSPGDQGTAVTMYFPALDDASDAAAQVVPAAHANLRGIRLLLVEDNHEVGDATAAVLREMGCTVSRAANAEEARAYLREHAAHTDIVVSDIVMPGHENGVALAIHIREAYPRLAVVLMSGYSTVSQDSTQGLEVLAKPCPAKTLALAIERGLAASKRRAEQHG